MIEIDNLVKSFGKTKALDGISLRIGDSEIYGFVGANGAGKTTTMRIISGLIPADSGKVTINGLDSVKNIRQIKSKIGYVPDYFGVYDNLRVTEYMEFFAAAYDLTGREVEKRCLRLLDELGLVDKPEFFVDDLSRGQKQRLALARAILHDTPVYIFDEATSNIDVESEEMIMKVIYQLSLVKTVILISHRLANVVSSDNIYVLHNGRVEQSGTHTELMMKSKLYNNLVEKTKLAEEFVY